MKYGPYFQGVNNLGGKWLEQIAVAPWRGCQAEAGLSGELPGESQGHLPEAASGRGYLEGGGAPVCGYFSGELPGERQGHLPEAASAESYLEGGKGTCLKLRQRGATWREAGAPA